ncbi:tripartite motif-containing protein 45-like isoform X2 [Mizuhopecten yessoensis]|uniref:tripartite motif-containing protein 45-like isoform X2 n=1 Tax=Mizuhopecten yessoensis TaxID=6573 RepID=UPI000B45A593|nr:tripartite motif-containing protein 45-like isoform X2 [Mizuhopecten yessoensis]
MKSKTADTMSKTDHSDSKAYRRRLERDRYYTTSIDYNTLNNMTNQTTSTGGKLAQEINDEFLTCKICLEGFKSPKCLDCLHTFCEQCIDNHIMTECTYKKYSDYREFTCPLCRKRTQLPLGGVKKLPDNFLVSSLGEVVARQKPSKFPFCDICKLVNRKHREASSKCLDCNKLLCKNCVELHRETKVTKNHSIFDVDIEKDIECKEHQEEVVRFYCEPCEACICVLCTFNEHKDHEITQFSDAVEKYKESIQKLLNCCKSKLEVYDRQLLALTTCESTIKTAEQKIRDTAIQFISDIRNREKQLIDDLHFEYGPMVMDYVNKRSDLQVNVDSLKSTCSLTELVLKGKDIELLLLKKQVQEKLSCLAEIELKDLPNTVLKEISFAAGNLDMGQLHESDKPIVSKPPRSYSGAAPMPKVSTSTVTTQTEETEESQSGPKPVLANQYIQTDVYGSAKNNYDTKSTETEHVETLEKGVNTRSRSLQSLTSQLQRTNSEDVASPEATSPDPVSSSGQEARRNRRRRERQKVEVSSRPTTNNPSNTIINGSPRLGVVMFVSVVCRSVCSRNPDLYQIYTKIARSMSPRICPELQTYTQTEVAARGLRTSETNVNFDLQDGGDEHA